MSELFDEVRQGLQALQTQVSNLSHAVVDRGGLLETHLPAIETEISEFWTGGDGIVYTRIDNEYDPIEIEYRNMTASICRKPPNTSKLTSVRFKKTPYTDENGYIFSANFLEGATNLTEIDFGGSNIRSSSNYAFRNCTGLTTINVSGMTEIGYGMFYGCTNLETVTMPDTTSIKYQGFYNCSKLENPDLSNIISLSGSTFYGCSSLTSINLSNIQSMSSNEFANCTGLTTVNVGNIARIPYSTFSNCTILETVIMDSVTVIDSQAFQYCSSLTNIDLTNVTSIDTYAFSYSGIESLDAPNLSTLYYNAFQGCTELTSINIPNITNIPSYCFQGCTSLVQLDLSGKNSIGSRAFADCTSLESLNLTNTPYIDTYAFNNCTSLETVNFTGVSTIDQGAFANTNLKSISLPDVTALYYVSFANNPELETVNIIRTESVETYNIRLNFNNSIFENCPKLKSITIKQMQKYENGNAIEFGSTIVSNASTLLETVKILTHSDNTVYISSDTFASVSDVAFDIYVSWDENSQSNQNAPWGATNATIHYNYTE